MALSASVSLAYKSGDNITLEFAVTDENDVVANITGYTPHFACGHTKDLPVLATDVSPATATATVTSAVNGLFRVLIDGDHTADLVGTYPWDAELRTVSNDRTTVARGYLTFVPDLV